MARHAGKLLRIMVAGLALLPLAACDQAPASPPPQPQILPPIIPIEPPPERPQRALQPSAESQQLSTHYQRLQADLLARGLLRTDGGGPDTAFTDTILARNFVRIALFDEYIATDQGLRAQPTISRLRRWEEPVRLSVGFGASVPEDQRVEDRQNIRNFASRLARVSNHPISIDEADPNFHVLILSEDDRNDFAPRLRDLVPGIDETSVRAFTDVPRDTLCLVLAFSQNNSPQYTKAVALIRAEHPDLMRLACIHEEIAQGLGLANDSPRARPSIFNDDEEFALLTTHDELLLRILYDDRLQAGMDAAEAAPIARVIARELMNSGPA